MNLHLMVLTDGRKDCLERTLWSIPARVARSIDSATVVDDSGSTEYGEWLGRTMRRARVNNNFEVVTAGHKLGFGGAIQLGWSLVPADATHVFHLEDDFQLSPTVDVVSMASMLDLAPHLAQLVLKRQAWNETEKAAGGVVESWPDAYQEVETPYGWYSEHRLFFSTNPSVYRRDLIEVGWPDGDQSERAFTDRLLQDEALRFAFLGRKLDPPLVEHIGQTRAGTGY